MKYKPMHPRKRMCKAIRELEQIVRDKNWLNNNRPELGHFDTEPETVAIYRLKELRKLWDGGERGESFSAKHEELTRYLESAFKEGE